jgi:glycosyltransferase involved in cell wall biosynthesis
MMQCLVSVVVPVYNTEEFLPECVDSILNQTCRSLELILVDDGSTDRSAELCDEYARQDDRVKVLHIENGGCAAARRRGLAAASGTYLYFQDSDDYIATDALEKLVARADADALDLLAFDGNVVDEQGRPLRTSGLIRSGQYDGVFSGPQLFAALKRNSDYSVHFQCHLIRLDRLREMEMSYSTDGPHDDLIFMFLLYMQSERCGVLPEPLFMRRFREGSITTSPLSPKKIRTRLKRLEEIAGYYRQHSFEPGVDSMIRHDMRDIFRAVYDRYQSYYVLKRREGVSEDTPLKKRLFALAESLDWLDDQGIQRRCRFDRLYRLAGRMSELKRRLLRRVGMTRKG